MRESNHRSILGPTGAPTQINFHPLAFPGPWQHPIVFNQLPVQPDGTVPMAVVGGATRLETIASRLLAAMLRQSGSEAPNQPGRPFSLFDDQAARKRIVGRAVALAADLLVEASSFQPPADEPAAPPQIGDEENPIGDA
ncbi:MAG TPA: hypothetical protein VG826_29330 [Pirellulales bacterium]|nr:hypothetical protein [Pirellulales bacterium]